MQGSRIEGNRAALSPLYTAVLKQKEKNTNLFPGRDESEGNDSCLVFLYGAPADLLPVSQLPTNHHGIPVCPAIIADTAPLAIQEHLYPPFLCALSIHQPHRGPCRGMGTVNITKINMLSKKAKRHSGDKVVGNNNSFIYTAMSYPPPFPSSLLPPGHGAS